MVVFEVIDRAVGLVDRCLRIAVRRQRVDVSDVPDVVETTTL
jgi:hypothetical protein